MSVTVTADGVLVEQWDDDVRMFRKWDLGDLVEERPYTAEESAPLDAAADLAVADEQRAAVVDTLTSGLVEVAAYQSIESPVLADVTAQVDLLTEQVARLTRLATGVGPEPELVIP